VLASVVYRLKLVSLRRQQLLFFAVVTVFVLILIGTGIGVTARYSGVFGSHLNRYFHIHEFTTTLSETHSTLTLYFRTRKTTQLTQFHALVDQLHVRYRHLAGLGFSDTYSRFELQAVFYGLAAYDSAARQAIIYFSRDDPRTFTTLARAERIYTYIDSYLERLFQIQLERGRAGYTRAVSQQKTIRLAGFGGIALVAVALGTFALLFSRSVTQPLKTLVTEAQALAAGKFDRPPISLPEGPELREFALAFNRMTTSIRNLLADLEDQHDLERKLHQQEVSNLTMEHLLREAQLVALQSQIHPHFLFNTLNSIARTARKEGAKTSEQLIRGLSSVLRYILRNPRAGVPLRDELRMVEDYLSLQAVRFGTRLTYRITVSPDAQNVQIPPLTLQPLVENAVLYGIEPLERGGSITITGTLDDTSDHLTLTIEDDGAGMPSEQVHHLQHADPASENATTENTTAGIGIFNVRSRLNLFFGEDHSFMITSKPGQGTFVEVVLPLGRALAQPQPVAQPLP